MIRFVQIVMLSVGSCFLMAADSYAQRGRGGGGASSRGSSSMGGRSGFGGSSRGRSSGIGHGSRPHIGGTVSGRSRLQHYGGGVGSSRRVPNSAASIRSLHQPSHHSSSRYSSSRYGSSRYGSSYNRSRYGRSSLGVYIGGISPYSRYGGYPYGYNRLNYGYNSYNYVSPSTGYYDQYSIQPVYGVPIIYNDLTISPPTTAAMPAPVQLATAAALPRNTLPARSNVSIGAPNIGQPGKAVLFNPAESGGSVQYLLNGNPYTIKPGEAQPVDLDRTWTLEFDRGLNNTSARYSLNEGIQKFRVGPGGWEVVQAMSIGNVESPDQPAVPAPPAAVESAPEPVPQPADNSDTVVPAPTPDDGPLPTTEAPQPGTTPTDKPPAIDQTPAIDEIP